VTTGDFVERRRANDPLAALPLEIGAELTASLRNAIELDVPEIFVDTVTWAQVALAFRGVPASTLARALESIYRNAAHHVPLTRIETARQMLARAQMEMQTQPINERSEIDRSTSSGAIAARYLKAALDGDEDRAAREVLLAIAGGMKTLAVYEDVVTPALHETGRLWQRNEIGIVQEHVVTSAAERLMAQLIERDGTAPSRDLTVAAASLGDARHQVAGRMVADAFGLCGWEADYLGSAIPVDDVLDYVERVSIDVLALSATLARDVLPIRALIERLDARPLAPLVIVGGRAFALHDSLWRRVGADGYAVSPLGAVALADDLLCTCSRA
jgi:MerR family transcriptional regulator, light-induced transcriptional regulator